jgi:hypothetical protein
MMNPPHTGLPSDIYHLAKKAHHQANQKGEQAGMPQLFMGGALIYIGATMALKAVKCEDVRRFLGIGAGGHSR